MFRLAYFQIDLLVVCAALLLWSLYRTRMRKAKLPLPPGPRPLPIIGNLLELSRDISWDTYNEWAKDYGDIVHISTFRNHVIILNSFKAAYDLLERRSSIYSDRPHHTMLHELMNFTGTTAFEPYGNTWRKHRTIYNKQMNQNAVKVFQPQQIAGARDLLRLFLESPQNYARHIHHTIARVVMNIAYGYEIADEDDHYLELARTNARAFGEALRPGTFWVNTFSILKYVPAWVPGAAFQKYAQKIRKTVYEMRVVPFREVKEQLRKGTARPSFIANTLTELGTDDESNEDVTNARHIAGGIFGAGAGTTTSALHSFILAMVLFPQAQKKAQAELDAVIGRERLPQFSDYPHLPYITALSKEILRWFPVAPTGVPHVTTEDDIYEGYLIPARSTIIANARKTLYDPEMYPDPSTFRPERFLPDKDGKVARDPATAGAFGFGRRVCAGRNFAEASIWITAASILSVFNISHAVDEHGHEIDVSFALKPVPGGFDHPGSFRCSILPRFETAETLIKSVEQLE